MAVSIYKKMLAVQSELPRLAKDGEFEGGTVQYNFLAANDVIAAVRPLLNKHGIIVTTNLADSDEFITTAEPNGARVPKERVHAFATYDVTFIAVDDGSSVTNRVRAEAVDTGEKSYRKLTTSAMKIALIQAFTIETGEPDEHELAQPEREEAPAKPTAAERRVEKAKPAESKTATSKTNTDLNDAKSKLKTDFIDAGKFTGPELNDLLKKKRDELGLKNLTAKVYEAVLADLEGAE